jgi:signal recognition particle GTPase
VEYAKKLAEHLAEKKFAEREAQERSTKVVSTFKDREEEFRTKNADYDDVVHDDVPITKEMAAMILESEIGPDVAYYLGKNLDEATRISRLNPLAQAREIGKIEAALSSSNPPVKKASSAPEPIKPVGSRSTAPVVSTSDPRSTKMSDSEWIKQRNAENASRLK